VDAGDFLFKADRLPVPRASGNTTVKLARQAEKQRAAALLLLDFYRETGCTVAGVGQKDLAAGVDFLKNGAASRGIALISANLIQGGTPLFARQAVIERGGIKTGFTAVTSCNVLRYHQGEFQCMPPDKALESVIPELREICDFVVLLSNAGDGINRKLAEKFPDIDLIIKSGYGNKTYSPQMFGSVPAVMTHPKGKSVAVATLNRREDGPSTVRNSLILLTARFPADRAAQARVDAFERRYAKAGGASGSCMAVARCPSWSCPSPDTHRLGRRLTTST